MAVPEREVEEIAQQRDILAAVLLDEVETPLPPPLERLQPIGALAGAEVLFGEMREWQPEADALAQRVEQVEGRQTPELLVRVAAQDVVVETEDIEPDDQVGLGQPLQQHADVALGEALEASGDRKSVV